jgi:hypothetical protein
MDWSQYSARITSLNIEAVSTDRLAGSSPGELPAIGLQEQSCAVVGICVDTLTEIQQFWDVDVETCDRSA